MAVRLELYRVFLEVAKQGNISAAAQNLFISQSAVSPVSYTHLDVYKRQANALIGLVDTDCAFVKIEVSSGQCKQFSKSQAAPI